MTQELHCYDYVNHPYEGVRDALGRDALGALQRATTVASTRAGALHAQLHAQVGPFEVASEVVIRVASIEQGVSPFGGPSTRLALEWQAAQSPGAFPVMHAVLSAYALTATETQLELSGTYEPPLGIVGRAVDAVYGRRIAEASVLQFIRELAAYLSTELSRAAARPQPLQ